MTKSFLIATVAALAITAPAQAADRAERRASEQQAKQKRTERAGARLQARAAERRQSARAERPQARPAQERRTLRAERPSMAREMRAQRQRIETDRPQARQQIRAERRAVLTQRARPERIERRARLAEQAGSQRIERRARLAQQARSQRVERRASLAEQARSRRIDRRASLAQQIRPERADRQRVQRVDRQRAPRVDRQRIERQARLRSQPRGLERRAVVHERNAQRFIAQRQRVAELQQRQLERRLDRKELRRDLRDQKRSLASILRRPSRDIGERIDLRQRQASRDWYDYRARRYASLAPSSRYIYDYNDDDGYLYKVDRTTNAVAALYPLLGGAFSVAQPLPIGYNSYNVPSAYRSLYYDTPDYQFRYGDGAIYRVDPKTQLIQSVVALLTGQNLGVGQMLPAGYDVYNVPYAYRDRFADSNDRWYRYADGYIYGVDPYSRRIQSMYPMSYGAYSVGYPAPVQVGYNAYPSYAGYGGGYPNYSVPYGYSQLYYGQPGYNYQYANGGIYQVDPTTQIVRALVALVTGTNLGVGQMLPAGYDVYNVPSAYRSTYFDTDDSWYRYNDGYIYEVDPRTRMIEASIPLSYGGYMVGQPVPAAYPGYAVPDMYDGLYAAQPGYDYRYFDGGIYAVNPQTRIVQSQVALLTGQTFGVGQMLPMGYDAYNVPFAYRDRYYDTPTAMYRYADGNIYQVDPTTRLIQAVIDAIV